MTATNESTKKNNDGRKIKQLTIALAHRNPIYGENQPNQGINSTFQLTVHEQTSLNHIFPIDPPHDANQYQKKKNNKKETKTFNATSQEQSAQHHKTRKGTERKKKKFTSLNTILPEEKKNQTRALQRKEGQTHEMKNRDMIMPQSS